MSRWLELFPACDLDATLLAAARMWHQATSRTCLVLWNAADAGHRFALAGETASLESRPEWMLRLKRADTDNAIIGAMNRDVGCSEWLAALGLKCNERDLVATPLILDDVPAQGRLCLFPAGHDTPSVSPFAVEVTTRALWQATQFESQLHQRKLSALAELAAGAGHEINNPLGTILGRSQQLLRDEKHPERRRWLTTIGAQALRIRDMIGDLMLFARPVSPRLQPVDLAKVMSEVTGNLLPAHSDSAHSDAADISLATDLEEGLVIMADATQVEIVLSELIRNSIYAMQGRGTIRIAAARARSQSDPDREVIRLTFSDTGPGLSELEREHLFDPFFSGRQAGRGLGFGLSKCWQILRTHGGEIRVADAGGESDDAGIGLTLILDWPASPR